VKLNALLLSLLSACAFALSSCSGPAGLPDAPVTGFAGYREWLPKAGGPVTDISAEWTVPQILIYGSAHNEGASTWIAVADEAGDFLQIGTIENELPAASLFGSYYYAAFWSDPSVGFVPQVLPLSVVPGNLISVRLSQNKSGWSLSIDDLTSGTSSAASVSIYPRGVDLQEALWIQEDPANNSVSPPIDVLYPDTTPVSFSNLEVNHSPPNLSYDDAQALGSPNGIVLLPGPIESDGFTLQNGDSEQWKYLRDVAAFDQEWNLFIDPKLIGGGPTQANGRGLIGSLSTFDSRLLTQKWPTSVESDIQKLAQHNAALSAALSAWESHGESQSLFSVFTKIGLLNQAFSNAVRAGLGLPPVGLDGAPSTSLTTPTGQG